MINDIFDFFCTATKGFVFSSQQKSIPATITGTNHEREVKLLINDVRRIALKKSMQLPETFSSYCDQDDWIQLAMITMFECCEKYDGQRPFDNYVRFMVSKKMADHQRTLLRKNPPADKEILFLYHEIKKTRGDNKAIAKLAEDTGKTVEQLLEIVNTGVGARTFTNELPDEYRKNFAINHVSKTQTPEEITATREMQQTLLLCLAELPQKKQALFLKHEIEEVSFKRLFEQVGYEKSFATFKRWYKTEIFDPVQRCVLSKIN